jgi:hypothetical protein
VAAHRMDLRDQRDVGACVECLDGGAHPGAAGADDEDVVLRLHYSGRYRMEPARGFVATAA